MSCRYVEQAESRKVGSSGIVASGECITAKDIQTHFVFNIVSAHQNLYVIESGFAIYVA